MGTRSLLSSQNWRFYSVLAILTMTIFMFGYNTFIINEVTMQNTDHNMQFISNKNPDIQHRQLNELQHASTHKDENDQTLIENYNAPSSSNILYHSDGYIIGIPLLVDECKNAVINQAPDKLSTYFPNLFTSIHNHWFVSRESYAALFSHSHQEEHYKTHSKRKKGVYFSKTKVQTPISTLRNLRLQQPLHISRCKRVNMSSNKQPLTQETWLSATVHSLLLEIHCNDLCLRIILSIDSCGMLRIIPIKYRIMNILLRCDIYSNSFP